MEKLPPHLYAVIRFTSQRIAGIFPSLEAAQEYRDTHCKSATVHPIVIKDDGRGYHLGPVL